MNCDHRFMEQRCVTFTAIQTIDGTERFDVRVRDAMMEFFMLQAEADETWGTIGSSVAERERITYLRDLRLGAGTGQFTASNGVILCWSSAAAAVPNPKPSATFVGEVTV